MCIDLEVERKINYEGVIYYVVPMEKYNNSGDLFSCTIGLRFDHLLERKTSIKFIEEVKRIIIKVLEKDPQNFIKYYGFGFSDYVIFACKDDKIIGFCGFSIFNKNYNINDETITACGSIDAIVVDPDYRGRGIGSKLLEIAERIILENSKGNAIVTTRLSYVGWIFFGRKGYTTVDHPEIGAYKILKR